MARGRDGYQTKSTARMRARSTQYLSFTPQPGNMSFLLGRRSRLGGGLHHAEWDGIHGADIVW